ncbi:MAG TPA: ribosome small subunit-dependent GTPase A [Bacillota bacterium]|nr:ribosome small subunit-dependent GTPase A [Bacillota bacterium]
MNQIDLKDYGLTEGLVRESEKYKSLNIGRVISQAKDLYRVITDAGELTAEISGKFRYQVGALSDYPAVGDFVMVDRTDNSNGNGVIHQVLSRKSCFVRKTAGTATDVQIVAANIDQVFICMALNNDFNLRRLERYLAIAWDSGATPVIVLTKADLCEEIEARLNEVSTLAMGVTVLVATSMDADGYLAVKKQISKGQTVAFIGSSGVGKSTLINRLLGKERLATNGLRNDDKGRHTTTRRELIGLPEGGAVIDTPGMRELGIISADFSKSFADIEELAERCRFRDCTHGSEPGCAVQKAINDGGLDPERLASFRKLSKEAKYDGLNSRQIEQEKINEMFGGKGELKNVRKFLKEKHRR